MQRLVSKRKMIIGALALLFLFSLNLASAQVRDVAFSVSSPFQAALWEIGKGVSTFFAGGELQKKNEALEQENFALQAAIIGFQEVARENEELRNILEFGLQEQFEMQMGQIIAKNIMQDTLVIQVGAEQGVKEGMVAITSSRVAVGRIVEVHARHSLVQLLSAENSSVDAQIASTQVAGLVRGQGAQKILLDLVPQEESFQVGDTVVTSDLGGVFPENLLIGKVAEIVKSGADPFQKARLNPFFSLQSAEVLFVVMEGLP